MNLYSINGFQIKSFVFYTIFIDYLNKIETVYLTNFNFDFKLTILKMF